MSEEQGKAWQGLLPPTVDPGWGPVRARKENLTPLCLSMPSWGLAMPLHSLIKQGAGEKPVKDSHSLFPTLPCRETLTGVQTWVPPHSTSFSASWNSESALARE